MISKVSKLFVVASGLLCLAATASCSRLPARIPMPKLNPASAATRAMELYDTDRDGLLSEAELAGSPSLLSASGQIDVDGNGISAEELSTRMQSWIDRKQALHVLPCMVYWRGRELSGAEVRFIPEPFLGDAFSEAGGTTDEYGTANIVHAPEDRPDPDFPQGIRVGFYTVKVSRVVKDKEQLPAKYNEASELGQEVAADADGLGQGMLTFQLK